MTLLLLLLSRFSHVRLCATPETAAHQAPLSLGFSRQEHWSGLPFPSPMHESEGKSLSCVRLFATPRTAAYQAPASIGFSRQEYWSGVPLPSPIYDTNYLYNARYCIFKTLQNTILFLVSQFSRSVISDSLRPHESQHARPPCPSPTPGVHSNSCPSNR